MNTAVIILSGNDKSVLDEDEDIYLFFDPEYPSEIKREREAGSPSVDWRPNDGRLSNGRNNSKNSQSRAKKAQTASQRSSSSSHSTTTSSQSTTSSNHDWRKGF